MTTRREFTKRPASPPPAPPRRARGWFVALGVVTVALGAWWMLPHQNRIAETTKLQEDVLAATLKGRERRQAIDQIIRNVDKMSRDQVNQVRDALLALWTKMERESVDAFAAAPTEERAALLDRDLARHQVLRELRFAVAARGSRRDRSRGSDADDDPARRELTRTYESALRERAKEKGVSL